MADFGWFSRLKIYPFVLLNHSQIMSFSLLKLFKQRLEGPFTSQLLYHLIKMPFLTILLKTAHTLSFSLLPCFIYSLFEKGQKLYSCYLVSLLPSGPIELYLFVYLFIVSLPPYNVSSMWAEILAVLFFAVSPVPRTGLGI